MPKEDSVAVHDLTTFASPFVYVTKGEFLNLIPSQHRSDIVYGRRLKLANKGTKQRRKVSVCFKGFQRFRCSMVAQSFIEVDFYKVTSHPRNRITVILLSSTKKF